MSLYLGSVTLNVTKNKKEYFKGTLHIPVRGAWSKKTDKQANICIFFDEDNAGFIPKKNGTEKTQVAPGPEAGTAVEEKK